MPPELKKTNENDKRKTFHFSANIELNLCFTVFKNGKSVVRRCHKFYGKRFATDS